MTYSEILPLLSPEDKLKAEMYAVSRLLVQKGFCSEYEYQSHVTDWFRKAHGNDLPERIHFIEESVARHYDITVLQLRGKSRKSLNCFPRQVFVYLVRALTDSSYPAIGKWLAMHHTSVLHGVEKIAARREADAELNSALRKLSAEFADKYGVD